MSPFFLHYFIILFMKAIKLKGYTLDKVNILETKFNL